MRTILLTIPLLFLLGCEDEFTVAPRQKSTPLDVDTSFSEVGCPDFGNDEIPGENNGVLVELFDGSLLSSTKKQYLKNYIVEDNLIQNGIYLSQIFVPTQSFTNGFTVTNYDGRSYQVEDKSGNDLIEWFGLRMKGRLHLPAGKYEFALLSDDGSAMKINSSDNFYLNQDFKTPTKMSCGQYPIEFNSGEKIPFEIHYNQGPRAGVAFVLLKRRVDGRSLYKDEPGNLCGVAGVTAFFNFNDSDVYDDSDTGFNQLLNDGWSVVQPDEFYLPHDDDINPCYYRQ